MKNIFTLAFLLTLLSACGTAPQSGNEAAPGNIQLSAGVNDFEKIGDLNQDGKANVFDAIRLDTASPTKNLFDAIRLDTGEPN